MVDKQGSGSSRKPSPPLTSPPPRLLELFKGTGSVGRVFEQNGWQVLSLDNNRSSGADLCLDVMRWDYRRDFAPGTFDCIWASPPCTEFSMALTTRPRDLRLGNRIVRRTLEIIQLEAPWFHNTPRGIHQPVSQTTALVHGESPDRHAEGSVLHGGCLQGLRGYRDSASLKYIDVDYCRFSDWGYKKRTRIWYGGKDWKGQRPPPPLVDHLCIGKACPNLCRDGSLRQSATGNTNFFCGWHHRIHLSSATGPSANRRRKYQVPACLISWLMGF